MKYLYFYIFFLIFTNSQLHADDSIEKIGDVLQIGLPSTALYMTFLKNDINGRVSFWESLLSSTMITISLKKTLYKKRPDASNYESFPSGHTTVAFSGASFITYRYGVKYAIPTYLLAAFVGYSRVHAKKHYWEDVIVGAGIGIINTLYYATPISQKTQIWINPIEKNILISISLK